MRLSLVSVAGPADRGRRWRRTRLPRRVPSSQASAYSWRPRRRTVGSVAAWRSGEPVSKSWAYSSGEDRPNASDCQAAPGIAPRARCPPAVPHTDRAARPCARHHRLFARGQRRTSRLRRPPPHRSARRTSRKPAMLPEGAAVAAVDVAQPSAWPPRSRWATPPGGTAASWRRRRRTRRAERQGRANEQRQRPHRSLTGSGSSPSRAASIISRASLGTSTPISLNLRSVQRPIWRGSL